jgi:hypothetical protein
MRTLLDHSVPRPLKNNLPGHDTDTAAERGWHELHNGELLDRAEADGYHLLVTADRQMPFQQNFSVRNISVLVLTTNSWPILRQRLADINQAINARGRSQISELDIS